MVFLFLALAMVVVGCSDSGDSGDSSLAANETSESDSDGDADTEQSNADDQPVSSDDASGSEPSNGDGGEGDGGDGEDESATDASEFAWESGDSSHIFDQEALHTFELNLSEEDLAFLDDEPTAEQYVPGNMTFEGETIENVGIRYKGSVGAFATCLSGPNPLIPTGSKTCTKLSMKVKINFDGSERTFYGLKKVQLHAMNLDRTLMHDRLGYYLFREMGVPAPRSTHARLVVNGNFVGVFALVEQIDGRFTREVFDDGTGNLYKEVWPLTFEGEPRTDEDLFAGLKTNEKDDPSFELVQSFASEFADAGAEGAPAVVEKWMDLDQLMATIAVDRTIHHDDGPFHFYCFRTPCWNHNFFFYEETEANRLHLIPWDLDNAFDNIDGPGNPVTPLADEWGETSNDCEPFPHGPFNLAQISSACDALVAAWASFDEEFKAARTDLIEGPLAAENVNPLLDQWMDQIRPAVEEANRLHDDSISVVEWEAQMAEFRNSLETARTT